MFGAKFKFLCDFFELASVVSQEAVQGRAAALAHYGFFGIGIVGAKTSQNIGYADSMHMYTYIYLYIYKNESICIYIYRYICVFYTYIYTCVCICIYTCVHIYTLTYTYIHVCTWAPVL